MSPTAQVVLLWLAFALTHLGLSSTPIRTRLTRTVGELGFQLLYSAVALVLFVPLVRTYFVWKHAGIWLWQLERGPVLLWFVYIGMGLAFVLLLGGILRPSPVSLRSGGSYEPRGVMRITRHPVLMAVALFGLFHLLPNGRTTDLAFFGGFVLFTPIGAWHQDRRKLANGDPRFKEFHAKTPFIPFAGRGALRGIAEFSPVAAVLGVAATVVLRYFHATWFG